MLQADYSILASEDAEQGLLGALLRNPSTWTRIAGMLKPDDFWTGVHGRMFEHIKTAHESGQRPDAVTLAPVFERDEDLSEHGGGRQYIAALVANVVSIGNVESYVKHIRELSNRRRFASSLESAHSKMFDLAEPMAPLLAETMSLLEQLDGGEGISRTKHEVVEAVVQRLGRTTAADSTGIRIIDQVMQGGLHRGRTYGIAAREKRGKTTLAHSISDNLNRAGISHAYVALEMGSEEIEQRQIARAMRINSLAFLGETTPSFQTQVATTGFSAPNSTIYVDLPGASFMELKAEIARVRMRNKIHGVILDYWQLVTGREKNATEESHLRAVAQWCADFGRKHNVWMIVIAQLNEEGNLFGGRGLRKACDQLYFLMREPDADAAWLKMDSSRYTPLGDAGSEAYPGLRFNRGSGPYFSDFEDAP